MIHFSRTSIVIASFAFSVQMMGQNTLQERYEAFKKNAKQQYDDFRMKANKQYADFINKVWQSYNAFEPLPIPKEEDVNPIIYDERSYIDFRKRNRQKRNEDEYQEQNKKNKDKISVRHNKGLEEIIKDYEGNKDENKKDEQQKDNKREERDNYDKEIKIEDVVTPPAPEPQPVPIAPIKENPQPVEKYISFSFYGTDCRVRFNDDERFKLNDINNKSIADVWERMSGDTYNNTIRDCLELRIRMRLCDWAYLNMLDAMAEQCLGKSNEATLLASFIYCQSGYKMRIGRADAKLCLLYASKHTIYDQPYFNISGDRYYVFNSKVTSMDICEAAMPKEKSMSLYIPNVQALGLNMSQARVLQSERYPDIRVLTSVNENLIKFYNDYPTSEIDNNFMTRWAIYAQTPMDSNTCIEFYTSLKGKTAGLGKRETVERLLNFVQTAFVYEYDDKVWGGDRAFFAEETLFYPYCDCEDRSILFSRLVRDLTGLDVVLVYYPGHLATAVCFDTDVQGDYIILNNRRFVVCDPTYIGAPIGATMPKMDNKTANVILL